VYTPPPVRCNTPNQPLLYHNRLLFALFFQNSPFVELKELGVDVALELSGATLMANAAAEAAAATEAAAAAAAAAASTSSATLDISELDSEALEEAAQRIADSLGGAAGDVDGDSELAIEAEQTIITKLLESSASTPTTQSPAAVVPPADTDDSDLIIPDRFLPTTYFGITGLGTVNLARRYSEAVAAKYMTLTRELLDEFLYFSDLLGSDADVLAMLQV
jgi:hypothetical protein